MKVGLVSGFFNPIHVGHIHLLKEANRLCDHLIVVVNNDEQVKLKGSIPFYDENARLEIIESISWVDHAVIAEDTIGTTIRKCRPNIIFQGPDRKTMADVNPAEVALADEIGADIILCVGDAEKVASSSELIKKHMDAR